ncbi:MAG: HAMP domain-containing protein [Desulfamplus sp.]|nr:HAMP domain-containing protein [Desulfamplus sp.]
MRNLSFNLSLKLFIAFLSTSLLIVVFMVIAMKIYAYKSFWDYIHNVEAKRLNELEPLFKAEYENNNGWERLISNSYYWHEIIKPINSAAYSEKPPSMPSGFEFYLTPSQPLQNPELFPLNQNQRRPKPPYYDRRRPPNYQVRALNNPPDTPNNVERPIFSIEHRLTLFDENKKKLIGKAESIDDHILKEIVVNGKVVGWLGLRNKNEVSEIDPLDIEFLKDQSEALYTSGAVMIVLAAAVSFIMSRHLIKPVKELIKGTRSLTARKFHTRINVKSSDELGELAQDFNLMAQTLEQYEKMRQQWISDIAHELRTPLSILRGEIEAIQDGIREFTNEHLESLHSEVVHLINIVGNLHDLSLAESSALHIKREPVNLIQIVRACLYKFERLFSESGIMIVDELSCKTNKTKENTTIMGDSDRLTQVFSNLLSNTLRYTDSPGCLIVSKVCKSNEIILIFADTKPGVPNESLERIFDRLYRVDKSRSRELGGSGLGLSICKTIIEAHNGTIRAEHAKTDGLQIIQTQNGVVKQHEAIGGLQIEITLPLLLGN